MHYLKKIPDVHKMNISRFPEFPLWSSDSFDSAYEYINITFANIKVLAPLNSIRSLQQDSKLTQSFTDEHF